MINNKLKDLINFNEIIEVIDIGAAAIAEQPVYKKLLDFNLAHLNAFEGDTRQIQKIKNTYGINTSVFSDFVSDGTEKTLYVAHEVTGMTSLLKPDLNALKFFNNFETFGEVLETMQVQTKKLDDILELPKIDFLKMDIQGSELSVLQNGLDKLSDCLAIQLEVSFVCLYENQPSFGEIDLWMRSNGFMPHCYLDVKRWSITPTIYENNFRVPGNQLLEADIVYIKNPLNLTVLTNEQLKKLILISHYCFSSYDLCVHLLLELVKRKEFDLSIQQKYYESLKS